MIYRIYRRIRYVRHIGRKRKRLISQAKKLAREELRIQQQNHREHVRQQKEASRLKLKFERDRYKKEQEEVRQRLKEQSNLIEEIKRVEEKSEKIKRKEEDRTLRKERRQLSRRLRRIQFRNFIRAIKDFNFSDLQQALSSRSSTIKRFFVIFLNSTIIFLLSYFAIYLLAQLATVIAGKIYHYPSTVYYWEIYFNISVEAWYHDSVKTIFSSGPIIGLFTGMTFLIIYYNRKEFTGLFKLFFLWGFLHGVSMFFGAILVGTLFEKGIGHVISWMYVMDTGKLLYSIISIFMLVVAGLLSVKPLLISGNTYYNDMTRFNRRAFLWARVVLPFLAGNVFLILLRQPRFMLYETFVTLSIAISLVPLLSTYSSYTDLYFDEEPKKAQLDWRFILGLIAVVLFYRGILNFGIPIP